MPSAGVRRNRLVDPQMIEAAEAVALLQHRQIPAGAFSFDAFNEGRAGVPQRQASDGLVDRKTNAAKSPPQISAEVKEPQMQTRVDGNHDPREALRRTRDRVTASRFKSINLFSDEHLGVSSGPDMCLPKPGSGL
jgi:hypothetical protein